MKLVPLLILCSLSSALGGELADQFPKKPKTHVFRESFDKLMHPGDYGIKQIGIERTVGDCPFFTFMVNRDGTFRYRGEQVAKRRGDWHGTVDAGSLGEIFRYVSEMGYSTLDDKYDPGITDMPGTYTLIVSRHRKKIIFDSGGFGPAKLVALENMIDQLQTTAQWKRH